MAVELYERHGEELKKGSMENRSFERLKDGEKEQAADYCFGKEWLRWVRDQDNGNFTKEQKDIATQALRKRGANRKIAIACAAIQLAYEIKDRDTDSRYFSDHGDVQVSMYDLLTMHGGNYKDCVPHKCYTQGKNCGMYCKDLMTNFGYTFRMCIGLLENAKEGPIPVFQYQSSTRSSKECIGDEASDRECPNSSLFSEALERYARDLQTVRSNGEVPLGELCELKEQMSEFALRSSTLGNFCCIPKSIKDKTCNPYKASGMKVLVSIDDVEEERYVNDQFALFLEWLGEGVDKKELEIIGQWKKDMLIDCCEGYYKQAAWYYKQAFISTTQKERIANFAEYLRCVNAAIEIRSGQIIKTIKGPNKS